MISKLFIKGPFETMSEQQELLVSDCGIAGHPPAHPFRHILILPQSTLIEFGINPGALKENIICEEDFDIHSLPSGTVLNIGSVSIRLTFHCEPCKKIKEHVNPKAIAHKRGYLGQIVQGGTIKLGDNISISEKRYPEIPYDIGDRIKWYLTQTSSPIFLTELMASIGLSASYCRAVPGILKRRNDIDARKILYRKNQTPHSQSLQE